MIFSLKKAYPFLSVNVIGRSLCQRPIFSLLIGKGENPLLIAAGFHGQEWLTSLLALRFAEVLLRAKAKNAPVWGIAPASIARSVVIVPCVNPDGVQIAINGVDGAGRYGENYRKILAASDEKWSANARGVDINHNFDAGWNILREMEIDSGILGPSPRRYGGYIPESEPESKAIVELSKIRKPRTAMRFTARAKKFSGNTAKRIRRAAASLRASLPPSVAMSLLKTAAWHLMADSRIGSSNISTSPHSPLKSAGAKTRFR